jgi:hypothetical protein
MTESLNNAAKGVSWGVVSRGSHGTTYVSGPISSQFAAAVANRVNGMFGWVARVLTINGKSRVSATQIMD